MFLKRLKTQATKCDFGEKKEMMLLCRVVFGLSDSKLKERLLRDSGITLTGALDGIRAAEITKEQMSKMADGDRSLAAVKSDRTSGASGRERMKVCSFCAYSHVKGKCPAYGKKCNGCGGLNHFEKACQQKKAVRTVRADVEEPQMNSLFVGMVKSNADANKRSWCETLRLEHEGTCTPVRFKIDTGAQANAITRDIVSNLGVPLRPSTVRLRGYNNSMIHNFGYVVLLVEHKGAKHLRRFEVVDNDLCPILGP